MYNAAIVQHALNSSNSTALGLQNTSLTAGGLGGLQQYTQFYPNQAVTVKADEVWESQRWIYVRKSTFHGKKEGETAGIILVDVDGKEKRLTMEELVVLAGWEW